ncbi:hypothetical protein IDG46_30145, partial [Staphylococcus sp. EG-SA-13]|nr:hypothetical protein [Staphylococcus sp. EG-SA-13]
MTVIALGTCLASLAAARSGWVAPRVLVPLTRLGRNSYEVYLTHMFVVFALFNLLRSPVALLFIAALVLAALLGEVVARVYSEPLNRRLRAKKPTLTPGPDGLY